MNTTDRHYFIFNSGKLKKNENTLVFIQEKEDGSESKKRIPIENVNSIFVFSEVDLNTRLLQFLNQTHTCIYFFNYYNKYYGSFYPSEYLKSASLKLAQASHNLEYEKRIYLAKNFISAATHGIYKNLLYYNKRTNIDLSPEIEEIKNNTQRLDEAKSSNSLMGIEGHVRQTYYRCFDRIINNDNFVYEKRSKRPPLNEVNALISFGNMFCYSMCTNAIFRSQLDPEFSYLHEMGLGRNTLSLDLAEIFKPIFVDRIIFTLINNKKIKPGHFDKTDEWCLLNDQGKQLFIQAWEDKMNETIEHKDLNRKIKYKTLINLECYKLVKHFTKVQNYKPLKFWW